MKKYLNNPLDSDTESIALGSIVSVIIAFAIKSIILAIPLGLAFALAHRYGIWKKSPKKKASKK